MRTLIEFVDIAKKEHIQKKVQQSVCFVQLAQNHHIHEINALNVFQEHILLMKNLFVCHVQLTHIRIHEMQRNVHHVQKDKQQMEILVRHHVNVRKDATRVQ